MMQDTSLALTPEQIAAVNSAEGNVYAHDPTTQRRFMLVEQPEGERLTVEELRGMLQVGIDQLDRGEGIPWNPEVLKERLRKSYQERGLA